MRAGEVYKHFKGNEYMIICTGLHTETNEECVVYMDTHSKKIFIRPKEMFLSLVDKEKYPDSKQKYRFEKK